MSQQGLEQFGAYHKARELFDLVVVDMVHLKADPRCYRLASQQIGSADSICANIEEGYGRLSRAEYVRFLDYARAFARETRGRYERMKHWLGEATVSKRIALADKIIGILTSSLKQLRIRLSENDNNQNCVREKGVDYMFSSFPLDTQPSSLL